ncbi:MAG: YiiX/YebB-like N1pC/P60 family cysteine hydrolase [Pseudomonadota bacterium]|nr:YiiX/YebB-like N1pC/P60 family cysteine hydrolase [Pseudomonadota bacterium]
MDLSSAPSFALALLFLAPLATAAPCAGQAGAACADAPRARIVEQRRLDDEHLRDVLRPGVTLYEDLRLHRRFAFQPGDVLLVRSDELVSAAISQIATTPAFFSHIAIVGLDPQWQTLEVVEAGVDEGLRATALDDWLDRGVVRFAVYRHEDAALAERAAIAAYRDLMTRRDAALDYDLRFDLADAAQLYCSEVVTRAFAAAAPGAPRVPAQLSDVGDLVDTFPLAALGVSGTQVFVPDDLETDPRFVRVLERRAPQALARSAALDAALRAVFETLRGPGRADLLAELDAGSPSPAGILPALLHGSFSTWRRLPEPARSRLAVLARRVDEDARQRLASMP